MLESTPLSTNAWRQALMYSNLLVGFVAAGFMLGTFAILQIPVHLPLLVIGGAGTFVVYQVDRSLFISPEDEINQPRRIAWARAHKRYVRISSLVAALAAAVMVPFVHPVVRWVAVAYAFVGVTYAVPIGSDRFRLKGVHLGKPVLIAFGWAVGGVLLPALQAGMELTPALLLLILYRFGFVLPNPLLADWLDRPGDLRFGIYTPAAYITGTNLRRIGQAVLAITVIGAVCAVLFFSAPGILWIDIMGAVIMLALISYPLSERRWFYLVTLDAIVAWPAVTAFVYFAR